MKVFFSGGAKNGKSTLAEQVCKTLAGDRPLYYIATMIPHDEEDEARIARHVASRAGMGFRTVEQGTMLCKCLKAMPDAGCILLDSVTALLSNEMFREDGTVDASAAERVAGDLRHFVGSVENAVFVSDYIYSDAVEYDELTELYRQGLALCDRTLASLCDTVVEVTLSCPLVYKGALPI